MLPGPELCHRCASGCQRALHTRHSACVSWATARAWKGAVVWCVEALGNTQGGAGLRRRLLAVREWCRRACLCPPEEWEQLPALA